MLVNLRTAPGITRRFLDWITTPRGDAWRMQVLSGKVFNGICLPPDYTWLPDYAKARQVIDTSPQQAHEYLVAALEHATLESDRAQIISSLFMLEEIHSIPVDDSLLLKLGDYLWARQELEESQVLYWRYWRALARRERDGELAASMEYFLQLILRDDGDMKPKGHAIKTLIEQPSKEPLFGHICAKSALFYFLYPALRHFLEIDYAICAGASHSQVWLVAETPSYHAQTAKLVQLYEPSFEFEPLTPQLCETVFLEKAQHDLWQVALESANSGHRGPITEVHWLIGILKDNAYIPAKNGVDVDSLLEAAGKRLHAPLDQAAPSTSQILHRAALIAPDLRIWHPGPGYAPGYRVVFHYHILSALTEVGSPGMRTLLERFGITAEAVRYWIADYWSQGTEH